jgi:hypothetical protein
MLPMCKSWLRLSPSQDLGTIQNELATGNARPGGMLQHLVFAGMCAGMVTGISEALKTYKMICPPDGAGNEQMVRMVINAIERRPEYMHEDFVVPVAGTLMATWPCRK